MKDNVKIAFFNPPNEPKTISSQLTWAYFKSYYNYKGKYADRITWINPPYKFDQYETVEDVCKDVIDADIFLFSSYIWNYQINKKIATHIKEIKPSAVTMVGGPQVDVKVRDIVEANPMYDYITQTTSPGELFLTDFLDKYFELDDLPDPTTLPYEARSLVKTPWQFIDINPIRECFDYFKEITDYANERNLKQFFSFESTRGCPFKCTYCEWGGGTHTKVKKKSMKILKDEIDTLAELGVKYIFSADANFGIYRDRDLEWLKYMTDKGLILHDMSILKPVSLEKQMELYSSIYDIVKENSSHGHDLANVSIQTVSQEALRIAKRKGLTLEEHLIFAKFLQDKTAFVPSVDFIRGMPGSTLDDFYEESNVIYDIDPFVKVDNHKRFDYMMLPDTEVVQEAKRHEYGIKTVTVYANNFLYQHEQGRITDLYRNNKSYYETISSCDSYTIEEGAEMFFMSLALGRILKVFYKDYQDIVRPKQFSKASWKALQRIEGFQELYDEAYDILNPETPPKNIQTLQGNDRAVVMNKWIKNNFDEIRMYIAVELF